MSSAHRAGEVKWTRQRLCAGSIHSARPAAESAEHRRQDRRTHPLPPAGPAPSAAPPAPACLQRPHAREQAPREGKGRSVRARSMAALQKRSESSSTRTTLSWWRSRGSASALGHRVGSAPDAGRSAPAQTPSRGLAAAPASPPRAAAWRAGEAGLGCGQGGCQPGAREVRREAVPVGRRGGGSMAHGRPYRGRRCGLVLLYYTDVCTAALTAAA